MKLVKLFRTLVVYAIVISAVMACDPQNNDEPILEAEPISTTSIGGYSIELLSDETLATGFNQLYWRISKDGKLVEANSFSAVPIMHMTSMSHSCPYTSPVLQPEFEQVYSSSAHFIMPSGQIGYWEFQVSFTTQQEELIEGTVAIEVASYWGLNSTQGSDGTRYFITWNKPSVPKSGNQDWELFIHKRESVMSFLPVTNAELSVYPYMDMGGGEGHSTPF